MATIKRLEEVDYDERTDLITPQPVYRSDTPARVRQANLRAYVEERGWRIVEPVLGWAPYTHLILYGDDEMAAFDGSGYALAEVE